VKEAKMGKKVYLYRISPTEARSFLSHLGSPLCHWAADDAEIDFAKGEPGTWRDRGAVFGPVGELRWRKGGNSYEGLLVVDEPISGLEPLEGEWEAEDAEFLLWDLADKRIAPPFAEYPGGGTKAKLRARVVYKDGRAVLVSPRELISEGEGGK